MHRAFRQRSVTTHLRDENDPRMCFLSEGKKREETWKQRTKGLSASYGLS